MPSIWPDSAGLLRHVADSAGSANSANLIELDEPALR
jgi:hypothetical protein